MATAREELRAAGVEVDAGAWLAADREDEAAAAAPDWNALFPAVELPPLDIRPRDRLPPPEGDGWTTVWPPLAADCASAASRETLKATKVGSKL